MKEELTRDDFFGKSPQALIKAQGFEMRGLGPLDLELSYRESLYIRAKASKERTKLACLLAGRLSESPVSGSFELLTHAYGEFSSMSAKEFLRKNLVYLPAPEPRLLKKSARNTLEFYLDLRSCSRRHKRLELLNLLDFMKLPRDKKLLNKALEKQDVSLQGLLYWSPVFLAQARIIIAEDPFTGMQAEQIASLKKLLKALQRELGSSLIFLAETESAASKEARDLCTRELLFEDGRLTNLD